MGCTRVNNGLGCEMEDARDDFWFHELLARRRQGGRVWKGRRVGWRDEARCGLFAIGSTISRF